MNARRQIGSTYRLQLGPSLTFFQAAAVVPYLAGLGVETLYLSPIAQAVPGSTHGYDGTDPTRLREELGGEVGFAALVAACDAHGLGLLIDHVPNHLATWTGGPWWRRLLAEGPDSEIAEVFDIAWKSGPKEGWGKVDLPLLDRPLEAALKADVLRVGEKDGAVVLFVGDVDLPIAGGARAGDDPAEVLSDQHYRLVDWHDAAARNYRRFFDIDGLVGVRVEVPEVFDATHTLITHLARTGHVSGIRVDHVDGLRDPDRYLRRLTAATGVPVVVEKILTGDEQLRAEWPVLGTTGYEVIDDLAGALADAGGLASLVEGARHEGEPAVEPLTVETRRLVAETSFPAEMARCAEALGVAEDELRETVIALPVYRTYLDEQSADPGDEAVWQSLRAPGRERVVDAVLDPARRQAALDLQQLTGAVMAKGVEDTAWYRLAGPLALCEVGGDPARPRADGRERLMARALERIALGRGGLLPGTTHDTKRSEDVRCRLYALSELAAPFQAGLARFRQRLGLHAGELDFETRVLAQVLLGVLPPLGVGDAEGLGDAASPGTDELAGRVREALRKGAREAKLRSSWRQPDEGYESRLAGLVDAALADEAAVLLNSFDGLADEVARLGAVLSLSAVALRSALPGVPDCYQGDETWNLSLVDPDNRRPVDFARLSAALERLAGAGAGPSDLAGIRRSWRDGRVKLLVTTRCLFARRTTPHAFFAAAPLLPLEAEGPAAGSILAFARQGLEDSFAVVVATRNASALAAPPGDLPAGPSYAGTRLALPAGSPQRFVEMIGGRKVAAEHGVLLLEEVLEELPVALLVAIEPEA